jgi:hypothetical protein
MLYSEIIAVCSQSHTKHINTLCGQNVVFFTGTYSNQWARSENQNTNEIRATWFKPFCCYVTVERNSAHSFAHPVLGRRFIVYSDFIRPSGPPTRLPTPVQQASRFASQIAFSRKEIETRRSNEDYLSVLSI